jgi:hypothetical protein
MMMATYCPSLLNIFPSIVTSPLDDQPPSLISPSPSAHGHLPLRREESSKFGSGGIWEGRAAGSGLSAASLFRVNERPRNPITTKAAPAIISQCGQLSDKSRSTYFPPSAGLLASPREHKSP